MWLKNILYLLLNDLYFILWGIFIKNNFYFKICINCLFLKEYVFFIVKFLIVIEVRFVKRGLLLVIRWIVSRICSDLSCRMIIFLLNWFIFFRLLDWILKVYCSLILKNILLLLVFLFFFEFVDFFFIFKYKIKWGLECINVFNRLFSLVWKLEERVFFVLFFL